MCTQRALPLMEHPVDVEFYYDFCSFQLLYNIKQTFPEKVY